jgi:hypothetical protein
MRNPPGNLVHVLVHVRTGIPFISLHLIAISIDDVCIAYKRDMQISARACGALQNAKNQTQNSPTSWCSGLGYLAEMYTHQTNIIL